MNDKLTKAQDVFLYKINQICNKFGLNNIMAQLYAVLYLSARPMSLDDMVERLKISKGSASINIRALERYGVVKRAWIKGSRKDYYEAESDIGKVVTDRIKSMAQGRLSEISDMIASSSEALDSITPQGAHEEEAVRIFRERVEKVKALYEKAQSLFEMFDAAASGILSSDLAESVK